MAYTVDKVVDVHSYADSAVAKAGPVPVLIGGSKNEIHYQCLNHSRKAPLVG